MIRLEDARALITKHVRPRAGVRVALSDAQRRTLAEPVLAAEDVPAFDRSAMDGYALRADDAAARFRIVAEIEAGAVCEREIGPGECARIFTGAAIPPGANAVLMQEETRREGEWMIPLTPERKSHIRARGEDARAGDCLLESGAQLGPIELSLLAQLGVTRPLVFPAPRVLHVATGGELVAPSETPRAGQLRDSNSTLIRALVADAGVELIAQERCGDSLEALLSAVHTHADDAWDFLLVSGGASVGDFDFGARALRELGFTIHFDKVDLRPGKPLIFGTRAQQATFVIPGNPLSHFICFHLLLAPALFVAAGGVSSEQLWSLPLLGDQPLQGHPRETWWPARLQARGATVGVLPCRWQSSGDITRLAGVDALARVPSGQRTLLPGEAVECLLLERRGR